MTLLGRLRIAAAAFRDAKSTRPVSRPAPARLSPARRPVTPLFRREPELDEHRREHAISLLDDECLSYVIVQVRGTLKKGQQFFDGDDDLEAIVQYGVDPFAWSALAHTMGRVVLEGDRVHGG